MNSIQILTGKMPKYFSLRFQGIRLSNVYNEYASDKAT